jgi:hypothetical protein
LEYIIRERFKYNPNGKTEKFDGLFKNHGVNKVADLQVTEPSVYLSVVVPAMNEEVY